MNTTILAMLERLELLAERFRWQYGHEAAEAVYLAAAEIAEDAVKED
jgi:hypothetical protein